MIRANIGSPARLSRGYLSPSSRYGFRQPNFAEAVNALTYLLRNGELSNLASFSRGGSIQTYFDANGVLRTTAANSPAFAAGSRLQIYEARTNQLLQSTNFSDAAWTKTRSVVVAQAAGTALDGSGTAYKLRADSTAASTHYLRVTTNPTIVASTTYTWTIIAKAAELPRFRFQVSSGFNTVALINADVNLTAGTAVVNAGPASVTMTPLGNGIYIFTFTATSGASPTAPFLDLMLADASGATSFNGDGTSGIILYYFGMESGAFSSPAIVTTTAAVTRNADQSTFNLATLFPAGIGAILFKGTIPVLAPSGSVAHYVVQLDDGSDNNRMAAYVNAGTGTVQPLRTIAGTGAGGSTTAESVTGGTTFRLGVSFDATVGTITACLNGGAVRSVTGGPTSGYTTVRLGNAVSGARALNGLAESFAYISEAVNDNDLQALVANF